MKKPAKSPAISLKHPLATYQPRLSRFIASMLKVKNLKPYDLHLWRVMDSVAFQDTETALETALIKAKTRAGKPPAQQRRQTKKKT